MRLIERGPTATDRESSAEAGLRRVQVKHIGREAGHDARESMGFLEHAESWPTLALSRQNSSLHDPRRFSREDLAASRRRQSSLARSGRRPGAQRRRGSLRRWAGRRAGRATQAHVPRSGAALGSGAHCSHRIAAACDDCNGAGKNAQVGYHGPVACVDDVKMHALFPADRISAGYLPETGDSRPHGMPLARLPVMQRQGFVFAASVVDPRVPCRRE